jgi:excisionase family DNA binding protein
MTQNFPTPLEPDPTLRCELLTVSETAKLLKVPPSWVYERTRRRGTDQIPHFKLGKYLRFSKTDVLLWIQKLKGF